MKTNGQKKYGIIDSVSIAIKNINKSKLRVLIVSLLAIASVGIIFAIILQKNHNIVGYYIALFSGVFIGSFVLYIFIYICIDEKCPCKIRILFSFLVNLIFSFAPTYFVDNYSRENKFYVYVLSLIGLLLLIIISYYFIGIEGGNDISLLKASNLFLFFLFTAIKVLNEKFKFLVDNNNFLINYYLLLPLTGLRGLYDLFDGKIKRKNQETCMEASKSTRNSDTEKDSIGGN